MEYILKGALVIDPKAGLEKQLDIHIKNGHIKALQENIDEKDIKIYDLQGKIAAPGFIDMHVHLREPGGEANETILTGCQAAVAGGFTAVAAMPNTKPCTDNEAVVELIKARAQKAGLAVVYPIGTITKKQQGEEISEIGSMFKTGIVAISDDGKPVINSDVMRHALEYAKLFDIPVISHCEDPYLTAGGDMHEGYWSTFLGMKGIPAQAEEIMVARDIHLAALTGGRLHLAHVSTKGSIELLRFARAQGIKVTAEATPHHMLLTDEEVKDYDTSTKVNPPLRSQEHVEAVQQAVKEGIVQCIASDHAPWCREEKEQEYTKAPNGISGLETAVAVSWDTLVVNGGLSPMGFIARFTTGPAEALNLQRGFLAVGDEANLTVIDPDLKKQVDVDKFYSKGKNSPYKGRFFQGWPVMTIVRGKVVMQDGRIKGE
ncbi:MAG: dihydroorotase [Firmicutes bacterium HGW-Firmicutes-12]|jgi:dihydroorotase|nr:MAG: dihydroorotase [Firmicutes bacterium HGW-Firmicutes-12]